jgi:hypothetical protein
VVKKYTYQDDKVLLIIFDVIILAVPTIVAFFGSARLLGFIEGYFFPYLECRWNFDFFPGLPMVILIFEILWLEVMRSKSLKNLQLKKVHRFF